MHHKTVAHTIFRFSFTLLSFFPPFFSDDDGPLLTIADSLRSLNPNYIQSIIICKYYNMPSRQLTVTWEVMCNFRHVPCEHFSNNRQLTDWQAGRIPSATAFTMVTNRANEIQMLCICPMVAQ